MNKSTGVLLLVLALTGIVLVVAPVQLLYASSGSMEPTISEGDIYVIIESDSVERGDIVAFDSGQFNEYVTHRVVDRTESGYITQGDANPSTDQAAGHPPVRDSNIIGTVVEVGQTPLIIPGLGSIVEIIQSNIELVVIGLVGYLVIPELVSSPGGHRDKKRQVTYAKSLMNPLFVVAFVACLGLIFVGSSVHEVTYVATAGSTTAPHTVPVGESVTRTLSLDTYTAPFVATVVDAQGFEILEQTTRDSETQLSIRIPSREPTGPIDGRVQINAYPATLPDGILTQLDEIHWIVAAVGSMLPIFIPSLALYLLYIHPEAPLRKTRVRWFRSFGGI